MGFVNTMCSISNCKNTGRTKKDRPDLTFHRFPKNADMREKWLKICARKKKQPLNFESAVICSDHFTPEDFQRNLQAELLGEGKRKKTLLPEAIPSKNLPPDILNSEDIKIIEKKPEPSEQEKIAKRKALVEEAIKWAESLPPKRTRLGSQSVDKALNFSQQMRLFSFDTQKGNVSIANVTPSCVSNKFQNKYAGIDMHNVITETMKRPFILDPSIGNKNAEVQNERLTSEIPCSQDTAVPEINEVFTLSTQQLQVEQLGDINGCSVQILKPSPIVSSPIMVKSTAVQTMQLPMLRPVTAVTTVELDSTKHTLTQTAKPIILPPSGIPSQAILENGAFADQLSKRVEGDHDAELTRKYHELLVKHTDLEVKYKRCFKTLCCFKTAYTKLKNQNLLAKNKITQLRERNKALDRQLKEKRKNKKHKLVQTISTGYESDDDVNVWW